MESQFTDMLRDVLSLSRREAVRLGHDYIGVEHLLLGLICKGEGEAIKVLVGLGADLTQLKANVESAVRHSQGRVSLRNLPLTRQAEKVLKITRLEAKLSKRTTIDTEHLLLAILGEGHNLAARTLLGVKITYDRVENALREDHEAAASSHAESQSILEGSDSSEASESKIFTPAPKSPRKSLTPILNNFSVDVTEAALQYRLDPFVGRTEELRRMIQILCRRKKNSLLLIGASGVGKTALIEGLAQGIAQHKVSRMITGKRLVMLELATLVAGAKYRGQLEERLRLILKEIKKAQDIILVIDDLHAILSASDKARVSGFQDAAFVLKPILARGDVQCIASMSASAYERYIKGDEFLEKCFQPLQVEATGIQETLEILNTIKEKYQAYHKVHYAPEALLACVAFGEFCLPRQSFPGKAIDIMDEAGVRGRYQNYLAPPAIVHLEKEMKEIQKLKNKVVIAQKYEEAAQLRDKEKRLAEALTHAKRVWDTEIEQKRFSVGIVEILLAVASLREIAPEKIQQELICQAAVLEKEWKCMLLGHDNQVDVLLKSIRNFSRVG